jgi:hypothetical protein
VDLRGRFLSESREIPIVTNMCVYWDEVFAGEDAEPPVSRLTSLGVAHANLRLRGFSRARIDPERKQPESFEYAAVAPLSRWNPTPGFYTRFGEVRELIQHEDDRLVIMGSGDELRLSFDGGALPPLPAGWKRDFLLLVAGWQRMPMPTRHSHNP